MIRQNSDPATRTWLEFGESFLEVVETFEVLDNNAFYSQVVTPDFLYDSCVVDTLDPDARGRSNLGLNVTNAARAGVGLLRSLLFHITRQCDRLAFEEKTTFDQIEDTLIASPILEADHGAIDGLVDSHHRANKVVAADFHDEPRLGWDLGILLLLCPFVTCKNVADIWIDTHGEKVYPLNFLAMDMRAEVWSPLQNTAVWLGAWLWGYESTDDLLDALQELGGMQAMENEEPFIELLSTLRTETSELIAAQQREPVFRLILSGPGESPALPAGSESWKAASESAEGAIVVRTNDPSRHLVLIPHYGNTSTSWKLYEETLPLPAPSWLSPGEADALLSQATNQAATLIEAGGYSTDALHNPRLAVGSLSDFYDTPGLPESVPPRAAKLFARADRVGAIIETVTERMADHSLDHHLLALWRHIRQARMAGVSYALTDFAR